MKISKLAKNIDPTWFKHLRDEFDKEYMIKLESFLECEKKAGKTIFPQESDIFSSLEVTPLDKVKVVIIGQDPYHGDNQAHGMSFSVRPGVRLPPSLRNIYKELQSDLGINPSDSGYLIKWSKQGVLLLNSVLTVEKGKAGSHQKKGWEKFTDKIIEILNEQKSDLVFLLWGSPAQKKAKGVDKQKHHILKTVHPSPLSAHRGWFGCKHFSMTNEYLKSKNLEPIDWSVD